jgi:parallel beta-helix repeat protein
MLHSSKSLYRAGCFCLLVFGFGVLPSKAQVTIHVPGDQPTIQAGINAATNGDTVLVAPGTYAENINFNGKAITVTSSGGALQTIIDGSGGPIVVTFGNGETRTSVINGFTVENGGASMYPNASPTVYFDGIKILFGSNPTITNNIITKNYGYGIEVNFSGALISGNTISFTATQYDPTEDFGCDYDDGDGIYVIGTPNDASLTTVISDNTIEHNVGHCLGGGIGLYAAGAPTITNNIIRYNTSLGFGGGIEMINGSALSLIQNLIYGNTAGAAGGGVDLSNSSPDLFIVNNTIVGNTINLNALISGDYVDGSQIAFQGSVSATVFFNNIVVAGDSYSAIACYPVYEYLSPTPLVVNNNDIVNFSGQSFGGWCTVPPTVTNATVSLNPEFVTANNEPFHLPSSSPAVNTGDASAPNLPSQDLDGNPRVQGGTVNMGVYETVASAPVNPGSPDFSMSLAPTSLTIQSGQSGSAVLTVTPEGGVIGAISFSCSGLPANTSCAFSPSILALGGDNSILATTITVYAPAAAIVPSYAPKSGDLALPLGAGALACVVLVAIVTRQRTPKCRQLCLTLQWMVLFVAIGGAGSCGGGSGNGTQPTNPTPPPVTPTTIVITASATGNITAATRTLSLGVSFTQ